MKTLTSIVCFISVLTVSGTLTSCSKGKASTPKTSNITVSTFAGSGAAGAGNGSASTASFYYPSALAYGPGNDLYIGDFGNSLVRTISLSSNSVSTYAGTGTAGLLNGPASSAEFNGTANIAFDAVGNLFVSDEENNVIREISVAGAVTTLAGTGAAGYTDGPGVSAVFNHPEGIVIDANGNLYVADLGNNLIRKVNIATAVVSTYAGNGSAGFQNGALTAASFNQPYGMALDASGNIYITDIQNNSIRKITVSSGTVSTYAGTGAKGLQNGSANAATFYYPLGCTFDSNGNLYVSDTYNNVIRKINTSGTVSTLAGTGASGAENGVATAATFNFPIGILVNGNGVYVADTHNNLIRKITIP